MDEVKEMVLPKIVSTGIFDAELICTSNKSTKMRKVALFEIEIPILDGGISFIDDKSYPINKNYIICAKPGQIRYTVLPYKCYFIHITLNTGVLLDYIINTSDVFRISQKAEYIRLFSSIIDTHCSPQEGADIITQSRILELIYHIYTDSQRYRNQSTIINNIDNKLISKARSFIDDNYCSKITLDDIAKSVHLSPIYFHNLFSNATGQTPYQYILEKRLSLAKHLLLFSEKPLTEIAFESGFSSQSYFNFVFKKELGVTPKQYQKNAYRRYPIK